MISMVSRVPVRPPTDESENSGAHSLAEDMLCMPCVEENLFGEDEDPDLKLADLDDPIVGVERVLSDQHGPGALEAQPLATPPSMTPAAFLKHCLTHLPYHPGCPVCAASRRPNTQHRRSHEHTRVIPLLVGDYGFVRSSLDDKTNLQTAIVLRVLPYNLSFACVVPANGLEQEVALRVARFKEAGLVHFAYRSDRETAITSLLEESIKISGRQGVPTDTEEPSEKITFPVNVADDDEPDAPTEIPQKHRTQDAMVAAPELTHPGESQSNGLAERAVESVVDHTRTRILALEMHLKVHIP